MFKTTIAGKEQPVLFQVFERRVLTYNPANPAAFRVEMGNVGQHYFRWRYAHLGQAWAAGPPPLPAVMPSGRLVISTSRLPKSFRRKRSTMCSRSVEGLPA